MTARPIVFLLDVDNTLLDNDRFAADLGDRLEQYFGKAERERYFAIFADQLDIGITGFDDFGQPLFEGQVFIHGPQHDREGEGAGCGCGLSAS